MSERPCKLLMLPLAPNRAGWRGVDCGEQGEGVHVCLSAVGPRTPRGSILAQRAKPCTSCRQLGCVFVLWKTHCLRLNLWLDFKLRHALHTVALACKPAGGPARAHLSRSGWRAPALRPAPAARTAPPLPTRCRLPSPRLHGTTCGWRACWGRQGLCRECCAVAGGLRSGGTVPPLPGFQARPHARWKCYWPSPPTSASVWPRDTLKGREALCTLASSS